MDGGMERAFSGPGVALSPRKGRRMVQGAGQASMSIPNATWDTIQENPLAYQELSSQIPSAPPAPTPFAAVAAAANAAGLMRYPPVPQMPAYVRWEQEATASEQVMVEPIFQGSGLNDGELATRVQQQMTDLYEFFRKLYEQDQQEISNLQAKLLSKEKEVKRAQAKSSLSEGQQQSRDINLPDNKSVKEAQQPPSPVQPSKDINVPAANGQSNRPVNLVFLPYILYTGRPLYRYYAYVRDSFKNEKTKWLAIIWLIIFVLAVALLIGLLVPWHASRNKAPKFRPGNLTTYDTQPTSVSFQAQFSKQVTLYYAVVPSTVVVARRRTRALLQQSAVTDPALPWNPGPLPLSSVSPGDLKRVATQGGGYLDQWAVACGDRWLGDTNRLYNISVTSVTQPLSVECQDLVKSKPMAGRCSACPLLTPNQNYTLIVVGRGKYSDSVVLHDFFFTAPDPLVPKPPPAPAPPSPPSPPADTVPPNWVLAGPSVEVVGEAALRLNFALSAAGYVKYVVVLDQLTGRIGNAYAQYTSGEPRIQALADNPDPRTFISGVVAAGKIQVNTSGVQYSCVLGKNDGVAVPISVAPGGCGCGAENPCAIPTPCFGDTCQLSPFSLSANTTYRVYVLTEALTTTLRSMPVPLSTVTTYPNIVAPTLSNSTSVAPTIGPYSFSITSVQQNKQGMAYVVVTAPLNQTTNLNPGSATPFVPDTQVATPAAPSPPGQVHGTSSTGNVAALPRPEVIVTTMQENSFSPTTSDQSVWGQMVGGDGKRKVLTQSQMLPRQLQQTAAPDLVPYLPPDPGSLVFLPPCAFDIPCNPDMISSKYVNTAVERLVAIQCIGVPNITTSTRMELSQLSNDTTYNVKLVTMDLGFNEALYTAAVRTVDLTPPRFTVVNKTTAFTSFSIQAAINEAGEVASFAVLQSQIGSISINGGWPPTATGAVLGYTKASVSAANQVVTLTYDQGVAPNTDYIVFLLARDDHSNVQEDYTVVFVHTDDNLPPNWLQRSVIDHGHSADLLVQLDEPAVVYAYWGLASMFKTCPTPQEMFDIIFDPATTSFGTYLFAAPEPQTFVLPDLQDASNYLLCLIAQDTTTYMNKQAASVQLTFATQDVSPPLLTLRSPANGGVSCVRAAPYTCSIMFESGLNERGTVSYVVVNSTAGSFPPTPANASALGALAASAPWLPRGAVVVLAGAFTDTTIDVPSNAVYRVLASAADAFGNINQTILTLDILAPRVQPSSLLEKTAYPTSETAIRVQTRLDLPASVFFVILRAGAAVPTVAEVLAGTGSGGVDALSSGSYAGGTQSAFGDGAGLTKASYYDVYVATRDAVGNISPEVASVLNVRTMDSSVPVLRAFTAQYTKGASNQYTITVNGSKPGMLYYMAIKATDRVPTRISDILQPTYGNFSGRINLPDGSAVTTLCIADPEKLQLWGFLQDREGDFPGLYPNNGTITQADVIVTTPASASCPSVSVTSVLRFQAGLAAGSPGLPQGPLQPVLNVNGSIVAWQQQYSALMLQPAGLAIGRVQPTIQGVPLPGSSGTLAYEVQGLPAASVHVVLRSTVLQLEDSGDEGRRISLVFQLFDLANRTTVSSDGLRAVAVVQLPGSVAVPFPACQLNGVGGIGTCDGSLASTFFPAPGQAVDVTVSVEVYYGSTLALRSDPVPMQLRGVPGQRSMAGPGVVVSAPYRVLHQGEMFRVTMTAVVPQTTGSAPITGYSVALQYNSSRVTYVRSVASVLWSELVDVAIPSAGTQNTIWFTCLKRTGADNQYRGSSITLLDAYFLVNGAAPVGNITVLAVLPESQLYPYGRNLQLQYNDIRLGTNTSVTSGMIRVVNPVPLALLAYLPSYDVFNTAVFDNNAVVVPITTLFVNSWAASNDSIVTETMLPACTLPGAPEAAVAIVGCSIVVRPSHSQPASGVTVRVSTPLLSASMTLSVWFPSTTRVVVDDGVLQSLLPHNANQPPVGCMDRFQATSLHAFANWTNGGTGPKDTLLNIDITDLASFSSNDESGALVSGSMVQGVAQRPSVLIYLETFNPSVVAAVSVRVTNEPVCITAITPLVVSGFNMSASTTAALDSSFSVTLVPQQDLAWEDAQGLVRTIVSYSDGMYNDITARVQLSTTAPSTGEALPFAIAQDPMFNVPVASVTAKLGTPASCGAYLASSLSTCSSVLLAMGAGQVNVRLPEPMAIERLELSALSIAPTRNGAALAPISLPTSADVRVLVRFTDGVVRDMSADVRTSYGIIGGSDLCSLNYTGSTGAGPVYLVASSSINAAPGRCTVQARVTIPGFQPLSASNSSQVITLSSLELYLKPAVYQPPSLWYASQHVQAVPGVTRRIFRCSFNGYEELSVWPLGRLSNCSVSGAANCTLLDLSPPGYAELQVNDPSVVSLVPNSSRQPSVRNQLVPVKAGTTMLLASFGAIVTMVPLSVEDTFLETYPKVVNISAAGATVVAVMTSNFVLNYVVLPSGAAAPNASTVERTGQLIPRMQTDNSQQFVYQAMLTGLGAATNNTVYISVRAGTALLDTVVAVSGVLIPDTQPPSFTGVGPITGMDVGQTRFTMSLPLIVSEPGAVSYVVYRALPCRTGGPTLSDVFAGGVTLGPAKCSCMEPSDCRPVAAGNASLITVQSDTLSITGIMPANPYDFLRTATAEQLVCTAVNVTTYASKNHTIYMVAQDDLPTYKGWVQDCSAPNFTQTLSNACGALAPAPCTSVPPVNLTNNPQTSGFEAVRLGLGTQGTPGVAPAASRPVAGAFQLGDGQPMTFTTAQLSTSSPVAGQHTLTFVFGLNRPGLVYYKLTVDVTEVVFYGVQPVFDPTQTYTVSIKQECGGNVLSQSAYGFWYWAVDVYGTQNALTILSVNFS